MKVMPTGQVLGATIDGLDLSTPLEEVEAVIQALGRYGTSPGRSRSRASRR